LVASLSCSVQLLPLALFVSLVICLLSAQSEHIQCRRPFEPGRWGRGPSPIMEEINQAMTCLSRFRHGIRGRHSMLVALLFFASVRGHRWLQLVFHVHLLFVVFFVAFKLFISIIVLLAGEGFVNSKLGSMSLISKKVNVWRIKNLRDDYKIWI
jgi:hypothetical protein